MADYRIVCTDKSSKTKDHDHIVSVGIGDNPNKAGSKQTVTQVRDALDNGDTFHTVSTSTSKKAYVEKLDCSCGVKTIRTNADGIKDDNLDALRKCNWTKP